MKILFLSAANSIHTVRWVNSLADRGHCVYLIYNKGHEPQTDTLRENIIVHRLKYSGGKGYYLNAQELRYMANQIKPDIINVHYASGYGTLARHAKIGPYILSIWGSDVYDFPYENLLKNKILKRNIRYAGKIASTSFCMAEQLRKVMGNNSLDIAITPFGVDMNLFDPTHFSKKNSNRIIIGNIKALAPKYGIRELVLAVDMLVKDSTLDNEIKKKISVEIYGDGEQKEELLDLISKLGLNNVIKLQGKIPNIKVPEVLSKFDVFCALSQLDSESFGVAVVEAMAMEVPVIVSDVDGFKEVVKNKETGIIVARNSIEECKNAMKYLVENAELRKKIGVCGRKRVAELFDWEKNVEFMESLYIEFLADMKNVRRN